MKRKDLKQTTPQRTTSKKAKDLTPSEAVEQIPIVGVGASAGGLSAFKDFFKSMPSETGMAFVLVQHLDPTHESLMVDLLSRYTKMRVIQAEDLMQVRTNHVYMIPPNWDLAIQSGALRLTKPQQRRGMRMPIDFFFNSLAEDQREKAICIILSGTGSDGTMGLKTVKSHGGMVVVQSPEEAQYDGMPASAIATGVADYILPVGEMANILLNYIKHSYIRGHFGTEPIEISEPDEFNSILAIMNAQLGHNFHYYKKNTVIRRIKRRMGIKQFEQMHDYVSFLRTHPEETKELFKDLLIGVTGFFREKESWELLDQLVIAPLMESKEDSQPVRIWVPGCSSGEEAYTLAIILHERFKQKNLRPNFNIFATDIDSHALEFARIGRYPESVASNLSEQLLKNYFKNDAGLLQVSGNLREKIVFSVQNLISDPPFSKLDLITCRNLLIYLQAEIQSKVIELFHFSLKRKGYLMLGNSETTGQKEHLFRPVSSKWRIYQRLDTSVSFKASFPILPAHRPWSQLQLIGGRDTTKTVLKPGEIIKNALLAKFAPTALLITRSHEILYHFGDTGQYLRFPSGEHTNDLFVLIREGLNTRIRGAVHKAVRSDEVVIISDARVKRGDNYFKVNFGVTPLSDINGAEGLFLLTFKDEIQTKSQRVELDVSVEEETVVKQLEHELSSTKEELQNTIEELETSNEELKASNEEIMSMNEELQSSNEELETSKEELQSLNEELNTVNNELQDKVRSLEESNNDINNLVKSTNIAAIFLDTQFRIKFYTPASKQLFNMIPTDLDRPLKHITTKFRDENLMHDAQNVLDTLKISSVEVKNDDDQWFQRKIYPYRTQDSRIEGVVLTFENITALKESQDELIEQNRRYADAQKLALFGNWELDIPNNRLFWSDAVYQIFNIDKAEFSGTYEAFLAFVHPEDRSEVDRIYNASIKAKTSYTITHRIVTQNGQVRYLHEIGRHEYDQNDAAVRSIGTVQDITRQRELIQQIEESEIRYHELFRGIGNGVAVYKTIDDGHDFIFQDINAAGERIDQVAKEKLIGKSVTEAFPGIREFGLFNTFQKVWQTGKPQHHPISFYNDGRISGWRENYVYKLPTGEIVAIYNDITPQKITEENLLNLESEKTQILNMVSEAIVCLSPNKEIKWFNDTAAEIIGQERQKIVGRKCRKIWCADSGLCEGCPTTRALTSKQMEFGEIEDGHGKKWSVQAKSLHNRTGEIIGVVEIRTPL
jgi:two-component system, chemotaxis family, CheB/CheR fusion protein